MGFLDKLRKKKDDLKEKQETNAAGSSESSQPQNSGRHIKKYTSDGKPVSE